MKFLLSSMSFVTMFAAVMGMVKVHDREELHYRFFEWFFPLLPVPSPVIIPGSCPASSTCPLASNPIRCTADGQCPFSQKCCQATGSQSSCCQSAISPSTTGSTSGTGNATTSTTGSTTTSTTTSSTTSTSSPTTTTTTGSTSTSTSGTTSTTTSGSTTTTTSTATVSTASPTAG